jgi:DNA replication initiation complex subunit (GINS family)
LRVRLTCKLANKLDGIDVSDVRVGDVVDLPDADATVLIKERWAEAVAHLPVESAESNSVA